MTAETENYRQKFIFGNKHVLDESIQSCRRHARFKAECGFRHTFRVWF